jgi:hypothetical protein
VSTLEWQSTLAGTFRRAAMPQRAPEFPPAPEGIGHIGPLTVAEVEARRADHEVFERAWSTVLATQRQIAAEGWPGVIVDVPDTRPAVLKAMDAAVVAAGAVVEVAGPGELLSTVRDARARFVAAVARQDVAGPS